MGFSFHKSARGGPFYFNLSSSGIGKLFGMRTGLVSRNIRLLGVVLSKCTVSGELVRGYRSAKRIRISAVVGILLVLILVGRSSASFTSFDGDLVRAEVVFVGRIVKRDAHRVIFMPVRVLRGTQVENLEVLGAWALREEDAPDGEYLIMSQGDDKVGKPTPNLIRPLRGQGVWRGWLVYPILKDGDKEIVRGAFAFLNGKGLDDRSDKLGVNGLFIDHVKLLLEQIPYNGHVNDNLEIFPSRTPGH